MQLSNSPAKLSLPWASSGGKNTIPVASQIGITQGAASLTDGFPPLTRILKAAGGIGPSGLDMNGVLYELSAITRWANAGGGYPFDSAFATNANVGGYPKGARVMRSDGLGYWLNTAENNITDPESSPVGWVPDFTSGTSAITMTSANVTLTPLQYGKPIIVITGTLTANLNLIFPAIAGEWTVINSTTGAFTVTAKTPAGAGTTVSGYNLLICDGVDIQQVTTPFASNSEAQGLTVSNKAIAPATLAAAFQGGNQSKTSNGYQKLPGGMILQWGTVASQAINSISITYPIAFPTECVYVNFILSGNNSTGDSNNPVYTRGLTTWTGWNHNGVSARMDWFAIGY